MFFGTVLGFITALMRMSPVWPVKWLARMYISIFRGTPLIAQLFMIYYGLPQFGIELDPIPAAMIGLSLNTAAYAAETLRAAIASIDKGQWEAAASIGMTPWQTMRRAILPRAARVALPPLSNSFISPVKIPRWRQRSSAGAVPSGAANHLANPGGLHHVSGGLPDLLGNGDSALLAAELF